MLLSLSVLLFLYNGHSFPHPFRGRIAFFCSDVKASCQSNTMFSFFVYGWSCNKLDVPKCIFEFARNLLAFSDCAFDGLCVFFRQFDCPFMRKRLWHLRFFACKSVIRDVPKYVFIHITTRNEYSLWFVYHFTTPFV